MHGHVSGPCQPLSRHHCSTHNPERFECGGGRTAVDHFGLCSDCKLNSCLLEPHLLSHAVWRLSSPWRTGGRCLGVCVHPVWKGCWFLPSLCRHRNVLLFGMSFFALFTMVSALTPSFIGLTIARAFQGNNRRTGLR